MRWTLKPQPNSESVSRLSQELGVDAIIAKLLVQRNIHTFDEAKSFFRPQLSDLHDPMLMADMDKAVNRVVKALENNEKILIYGDYDVDGTTAVSVVYLYLKTHTQHLLTYVPDRDTEGYGISFKSIEFAKANEVQLIIALDCGIKDHQKIAKANDYNIDSIICDHHTPSENLPEALAVLNPKRLDCNYPYKELSGCGIGFKLIQALHRHYKESSENLMQYIDFVAVSIAADIVPMTGENRILCYYGLQKINTQPNIGLLALMGEVQKHLMEVQDLVFLLAPRINAAGRMQHASYAVDLLTETDLSLAQKKANAIGIFNTDRKNTDETITRHAIELLAPVQEKFPYSNVVFDTKWHKGVIGIVASRIIETYYKPTVVFTKNGDFLVGSARSVAGFDLYHCLEKCQDVIEQFGGHKYAAGLRILPDKLNSFKEKFEQAVRETITEEQRVPEIKIDTEIFLSDITDKLLRIIRQMAPFGPDNMQPVFRATDLRDNGTGRIIGNTAQHLRLNIIESANPKTYQAVGFGLADKIEMIKKPFDIAFTLEENEWNGIKNLQLKLKDIKNTM